MSIDLTKQLERQVKEKCGNRVVKVILERFQVVVQKQTKSHETSSSLKIFPENRVAMEAGPFREPCPGPGPSPSIRPQRSKINSYTHYFDAINDSVDDSDIGSNASCFDSAPEDTSDSEFGSPLLSQTKTKSGTTKSNKYSTSLDPGNKNLEINDQSSSPKKQKKRKPDPKLVCSICNSIVSKHSMRRHWKHKHPNEELPSHKGPKTTCDFCPSSLTKSNIWRHLEKKHPAQLVKNHLDEPRRVRCDLCPSVLLLEELIIHKKTQHSHASVRTSQCDLCSLEFTTQHRLENHILRVHVVDKPCECSICFKSFLTEELLQEHVKRLHEDKNFHCRSCPTKSFQDSASLKKHIEAAHRGYKEHCDSEAIDSSHMCPACDTWFFTHADLAKHLKKPESKSLITCEICSELVYTPCRLNLHRQKIHSENQIVDDSRKCNQLEGVVESPVAKQGPHSEKTTEISAWDKKQISPNNFSCVVCSALFSRRCDLDLHELQEKHRRWKCPICGKLFNWRKDLKTHIQSVHSDARPFHCTHEGCSKTYKVMKDLKKHMVMHAVDRVLCKECFKYFTQKAFTIHEEKCHEGNRRFECHFCSITLGTLSRLKMHLLTHTKERPFPCKFCDASYKCSKEVNRHMKKCQDRSEDQRKETATLSNASVRSAEKRKPKKQDTSRNGATKRALTSQPTFTTELNCAAPSFIGNEIELKLIKQEEDPRYSVENSSDFEDERETGVIGVKLEFVPKQEMSP